MLTQGSGPSSINTTLAADLSAQPWAALVSPEILAFDSVGGQPVLVRGADAATFVQMEGGRWLQQVSVAGDVAYVGSSLAGRLGLSLGDNVTLVGSTSPHVAIVQVAGLFMSSTTAADEILVGFTVARGLTDLRSNLFHTIRVETSKPSALVDYLRGTDASVHLSGPGLLLVDVNSAPPSDERLTNLLLRFGSGQVPLDFVPNLVSQGTNSIRVVVLGLGVLLALLVALGVHAIQARAFADRRETVGVLRSLGAGNGWLRRRMLLETLPLSLVAGLAGTALGALLAVVLSPVTPVVVFGHEVHATLDPIAFVLIVAAIVLASVLSNAILLGRVLRERPMEAIQDRLSEELPRSLEVRV